MISIEYSTYMMHIAMILHANYPVYLWSIVIHAHAMAKSKFMGVYGLMIIQDGLV